MTGASDERLVGLVRGTRDRLPAESARLARIESTLLDRFATAGYVPVRIPILERTDLHERKSGAGIVSKLYELGGDGEAGVCLRPELTAGVVRAYAEAAEPPDLPWRVSVSGPVFRHEAMRPGFDREFTQVGVEMLGAGGPAADAEVIWLAWWGLLGLGVSDATVRIGHVGLILEMLERSGLPEAARAALVERLSEAATDGGEVAALETAVSQLAEWFGADERGGDVPDAQATEDDPAVARLFRTLVPDVTGRRSGREVVARLRRKWALGRSLHEALADLRTQVRELADLRGPISEVLPQLEFRYEARAPESIAALRELTERLNDYGVDLDRVELDLGFGRGIGFYSRMVFGVMVPTPDGPVEVCGGGRYDGLARVFGSDRDDRGVGFAFGLERVQDALDRRPGADVEAATRNIDVIVPADARAVPDAIRLAARLRESGRVARLDWGRSPEEAIALANRDHLGRVLVVGHPDARGLIRVLDLFDERTSVMTAEALISEASSR